LPVTNRSREAYFDFIASYTTVETFDSALDVPAGDCFKVHEKICLMNAEPLNGRPRTTVRFSGRVDFTKSTWLKSVIEKNALDGVRVYFEDMDKILKEFMATEAMAEGGSPARSQVRSREAKADAAPETPLTDRKSVV
jgi:hypothetical protein